MNRTGFDAASFFVKDGDWDCPPAAMVFEDSQHEGRPVVCLFAAGPAPKKLLF